ncbi:creatininase family protein [Streptomyces sp. INA 01156]
MSWFGCGTPGGDAHAGRAETSLMLHLAPGDVRLSDAVAGDTRPLAALMPDLVARGVRGVSRRVCWATRPGRRPRRAGPPWSRWCRPPHAASPRAARTPAAAWWTRPPDTGGRPCRSVCRSRGFVPAPPATAERPPGGASVPPRPRRDAR